MDRFSCYKVECSHLSFPTFKRYLNHIRNSHSFEPNFKIACTVEGCFQTFTVFTSFTSHLYRKHQGHIRLTSDDCGQDESTSLVADELQEDISHEDDSRLEEKSTRSLFLSVVKMQEIHMLTDSATSDILNYVKDVVDQNVNHFKERVQRCLKVEGMAVDEVEGLEEALDKPTPFDSAFERLQTVRQRTEYVLNTMKMVEPEEVVLGEEVHFYSFNGRRRFKVKRHTFQYISVISMLQVLLNQYDVFTEIEHGHSMPEGKIRDFCDGSFFNNHPLFSANSKALQIMTYFDEFEVCDPLGSKASKHKMAAFYWMLGNLHPKYRSVLRSMQLVAICPSRYLNRYGFDKVLHRFMVEINMLESDAGIPFEVNGVAMHFSGTIGLCLADNLGSHSWGGFMESFSAYRKCRFCMGTPEDIQQKFTEEEFVLRSRIGHDHHLDQIEADPSCTSVYGVKRKSPLNKSKYFHVVDGLPSDIMHDLLEGVIPRHLKLLLRFFIMESNFFTLEMLNEKIKTFDYGIVETSNRPSTITNLTLSSNDDNLKQSAAQMWCLARYFPLMITEWIPPDNDHLILFCDLLRIVDLCCAPVTSATAAAYLRILIKDYLQEMLLLYPSKNISPKQHFLVHYPRQLVQVGPLIRLWCMRFEAKNHYFKKLARSSKGFQNLCKTLAIHHQRLQSYWLSVEGGYLRSAQENGPGRSIAVNEMTRVRQNALYGHFPYILPDTILYRPNWVQCFGTKYQTIDNMNVQKTPFINSLTNASKEVLDEHIKKALDSSGFTVETEKLEQERRQIKDLLKEGNLSEEEKDKYDKLLKEVNDKIDAKNRERKAIEKQKREEQAEKESQKSGGEATKRVQDQGGCFPGSSTFVDRYGLRREMHSLQTGEKVQVAVKGSICLEPVITFIHREQEKLQEFLSITTTKNNNLKISEDHLLFVEKNGLSQAIPARDVKIGDTAYVKQNGLMRTATVQDISTVYEKGVYAPVTRSGTILVNDVHTSCYFDVLSHKLSHRAMAVPRAVYHVSPRILRWISGFGEKDGFPGWCRLAHKILT